MKKIQHLIFLIAFCLLSGGVVAQVQTALDQALRHIEENQAEWGLDKADIQDLKISDHVFSKVGSIDHYYFIQRHDGVEVYNAINSVHINAKGKVASLRNNFIPQLASKINTTSAKLKAADAIKSVFQDLAIPSADFNYSPINRSGDVMTFAKGKVSNVDIQVRPIYQVINNEEVRLAWNVTIDPVANADYWSIRVDATDGNIIDQTNFTLYCKFHADNDKSVHSKSCADHNHATPIVKTSSATVETTSAAVMGGSYNVFAEMIDGNLHMHESPIHGDRNIITDPADLMASPYGWHDVDGVDGAEFEITRGNNVHAYLDADDNDSADAGSDIEGSEELSFDFPWTDLEDPENSEAAAITNLFFMNNYIHDFTYAYGFDESGGNFQANNYGNSETGANDYVRAEAQDGRILHYADPVNEADHINNANFATPSDGASPRMQMYVWNRTGGRLLEIKSPTPIAGLYETATASFGPMPADQPVVDTEVALAFDADVQDPSHVCGPVINPADIAGKVAMIDRGTCTFVSKTVNAEEAGAVAVIICNFEDPAVGMGGDLTIPVGIPAIMVSNTDCNLIKTVINNGQAVSVSIGAGDLVGAEFYDGDVDNGIIAHEFGHGVSNRLVGGPSNTGCLGTGEQMGEGWSDFLTLVSTVKPGELGSDKAGIGTYISREAENGNGIRSNPYSTDMSIDPETFADLPTNTGVHALGAVWTSMIWDMYWALVDEYGFSNDLIHGELGNNIAVRLVLEGMKLTACGPGFVDGRDGILSADALLYDGANSCIIWKAFARRGLGENASQGSSDDPNDGVADFNPPPGCVKEVKLAKRLASTDGLADVVTAGDAVDLILTVRNDKEETATGVVLTESIPAGAMVENISNDGQVMGDNIVWALDTIGVGQEIVITYSLIVDPNTISETLFIDDLEDGGSSWVAISEDPTLTPNQFDLGTTNGGLGAYSGNNAFFIVDPAIETQESLILFEEIDVRGENPGIRFFQNYDTEAGSDGILVQVSFDGGVTWDEIPDQFFKNGYPSSIQYTTFVTPFLSAFSGNSNGWVDTWIDLSPYRGEIILMRFRFGSDDNNDGNLAAIGWAMDDFEYLDVVSYNTTATLTTAEGDLIEQILPNRGIKVNSDGIVAVDDIENPSLEFNIFPNPASETVKVAINNLTAKDAQLSVYNYTGQLIEERNINLSAGNQTEEVNVRNYPTGFYFFQLATERGIATEKVMVGK